ncbi:MAG: hypothetical protein LQ340_005749 [Diploschistes diacapsis]|nr:MAG: hypothetical protein LQ340_005749 [Diploschistes diacapsis]
MRSAVRIFYLAFFSLFRHSLAEPDLASEPDSCAVRFGSPEVIGYANHQQLEPKTIVSDACASFGTLEYLNDQIEPALRTVTHTTDFFGYYRLNLYSRQCPFWDDQTSLCGNIACAVSTLDDEEDIPQVWRAHELSKLEGPRAEHPGRQQQQERGAFRPLQGNLGDHVGESCVVEYDDEFDERDYCIPEDQSATAKGDYVSLLDNPEKFTGYAGEGPHMVWDAIYRENCFSKPTAQETPDTKTSIAGPKMFKAADDLRSVMQAHSNGKELLPDDTCLEKRVFYRVISGMHASISAHLCYDYLDQKTGKWGPNQACYEERLAKHPDRVSNLYFNYALVLRAIGKLQGYLQNYTFCSGDPFQDRTTKNKVLDLAAKAADVPVLFDESKMFQDGAFGVQLKEDFRQRFRNVSRLMDCVGCDKCRLWGKLQTAGYGAALKVLFEYEPGKEFYLKRTELVALVNTLGRISNSITALTNFRDSLKDAKSPTADSWLSAPTIFSDKETGHDDLEDWNQPLNKTSPQPEDDPVDEAWEELDLIWRTFKLILKEWWGLPKKVLLIVVQEFSRVWTFWLGLPAPHIAYEWATPPSRQYRIDEL